MVLTPKPYLSQRKQVIYAVQEDLDTIRAYAKTRASAFDVSFDDIAKEFITDKQREGLRKLLNFDFTRD